MKIIKTNHHSYDRVFGLDVLRALAILMVMLFHATPLLQPLTAHKYGKIISIYIKMMIWFGPISVDLFFVLSGFLIGRILIRVFLAAEKFKLPVIWEFWIKRWFRTLPNYLFLLSLGFVLYYLFYRNAFDWRYYLFLQNFTHAMPKFFGETWSLSIEEWTYLLLPLAILLITSIFKRSEKRTVIKYTIILYIIIAVAIRFIKICGQNYHDLDEEIRKVTLYRLDAILYGVFIAYLIQYHQPLLYKYRKVMLYSGISGVLFTLLLTFASLHLPHYYYKGSFLKIALDTLLYSLIPIFFSFTLPAAYFFKETRFTIVRKGITHLSLISYSLYLIHNTLIFIPFFLPLSLLNSSVPLISAYFGFIIICIMISSVNYYYFERPATRLREIYINNRDKKLLRIKTKANYQE